MKIYLAIFMIAVLALTGCSTSSGKLSVNSPDGKLAFSLKLDENGSAVYSVTRSGKTVLGESPLGLVRNDADFSTGLQVVEKSVEKFTETYTLNNGKRKEISKKGNELTVAFLNADNAEMNIIVRAFNDGFAFKYSFPQEDGEVKTILNETTGFQIPGNSTAVIMPYDDPTQWTPAYENFYGTYSAGTSSPMNAGWAFPALFKVNEGESWLLLTESGLTPDYCGTRLNQDAPNGLYTVRFSEEADAEGLGSVAPSHNLPWETSWKVLIVADTAAEIAESTLPTDVAVPAVAEYADWIKPGRSGWSWWSDSDSPRDFVKQRKFIDLCAEMGWEYYLVDANWNYEPQKDLIAFVEYAKEKNVDVLLWYNSGGPQNIVTEAPRDRMYERERRREEMAWMQKIGVKGMKVDFWHSDKQNLIQLYWDLFQDAYDFGLMVNTHGCTIPRGWERTFPNLMSMESVRGAECYKFDAVYPETAPSHNVNLVFTRNVIGPMDYTPVCFTDMENPHLTTFGHELALSIVFQSGWLHLADAVEGYRALPQSAKQFLMDVPVSWDDTDVIDGEPENFVVMARKSGGSFYIAAISGMKEEKAVEVDFAKLGISGQALLITDGDGPRNLTTEEFSAEGKKTITMQPLGGFVIEVK